ncbi:MAG TPA: RNase adapter RapZ, partial [Candidatus Limnocylindrales bacterium]|nr:RNase adapter RapZ [Candidatus Limnocylindrales bacterium]
MADEVQPRMDARGGPHVVLLSGLSGGGKTAAAKLFEDLAYTVVDNLPGELLANLAELVVQDPL